MAADGIPEATLEAVAPHMKPVEELENGERLITSADINKAGTAKASALWGGAITSPAPVSEEAIEAAAQAEWVRCGSHNPIATWETEDPEYKEYLRTAMRPALEAASPFMRQVITSGEGLLPGTVVQDKSGDVLKLMNTGDWFGTDEDGPTFVEYPATVLVKGDGKGRHYGYSD